MRLRHLRIAGLHTMITTPRGAPPRAHLVLRTPYGAAAHLPEASGWAEHGIACVLQDVRGRYGSPGAFAPFEHESEDGAALMRWLRDHLDGPLILYGPSYAAHCALAAHALEPADALALLVPALGLAETARTVDGEFELAHRIGWWSSHGHGPRSRVAPPLDLPRLASRPLEEVGDLLDPPVRRWREIVAARRDPAARRRRIAACRPVPLLTIGGSRDWFAADACDLAAAWPGPSRLVLGPWDHSLDGAGRAARILGWWEQVSGGTAPDDVVVLDDLGVPLAPPGADWRDASPAPTRCEVDTVVSLGCPARIPLDAGPLYGDLSVHLHTDAPDGPWFVDLVRRHASGVDPLAHAAGPSAVLRLGPVLAAHRPDTRLELRIAAGDVPRHPMPADAGHPRRLEAVRLERTA